MKETMIIESLERVISLGERLLTTFDVEEVLTQVVRNVKELLNVEGATLYLIDPVEKLMISQVILSDRVEEIVLKVTTDSIAGFTALHRHSVNIPDAYGDLTKIHPDLRFNKAVDESSHYRTRNILTHPLIINGELIGVFQVVNKPNSPFDADDERILKNLAVLAGIAVLNARLVERINEEQHNAYDIIEHISDRVIVQDLQGHILHLNHKAAEVLPPGITPHGARGRITADLFPLLANVQEEVRKVVEQNLDKTFSGGKMPYVVLTARNSRQAIEKVILIIKDLTGAPDLNGAPHAQD